MYSNFPKALKSKQFRAFLHLLEKIRIETLHHPLDFRETELPAGQLGADPTHAVLNCVKGEKC